MNQEPPDKPHIVLRYVFLACGHVFLAVGVIGVFVPLLPTTPFLLLAAWCYSKGSEAFESWLINHKYLGPPVVAWRLHRVVRPGAKIQVRRDCRPRGVDDCWCQGGDSPFRSW